MLEKIRAYCLSKANVTEELPFDEFSPVYKVHGKIFLIANLTPPYSINIKCDPARALELRELHTAIQPGYHMNKKHWNTVSLDGSLRPSFLMELVDHSYALVLNSIPVKKRK